MRKLRVFESISIDGYFVDAAGDSGWAHAGRADPEFAAWVSNNASAGGELLFGRKTYQLMEAFWPTPLAAEQMPAVAKGMNAAKKYVASRTLTPTWNNSELLRADLVDAVRSLLAGTGPDITVLGEARLVHEYQFVVVPVALGAGRTVFSAEQKLTLVGERAFKVGNVVLTYAA